MRGIVVNVLAVSVAFLLVGNLFILAATTWAKRSAEPAAIAAPEGVHNFRTVSNQLWRGAAPSTTGYESLAAAGVTTIVDLRAETDIKVDDAKLLEMGINRVHLPVRDGQVPPLAKVQQFMDIVRSSPGTVFVHCGAGVGRTGAMVAAYLVQSGQASGVGAVRHNLSVGPPSLEQLAFAATLEGESMQRPNAAVTAVSRTLDAPRRLWSVLTK